MISIAVCDDEFLAVQAINCKIKGYMQSQRIDCTLSHFLNGESLLESLANTKNRFDAIFLDIQMHQANGIEVAKVIRQTDSHTMIVFVTALKEYVFDAFDVSAMQYLLKPIRNERLFAVLHKIVTACAAQDEFLVLHRGGEIRKIVLTDILYCEAVNHRVFVYQNGCTSEFGRRIEDLEQSLNCNFFRCHRSYIVNLQYVESYKDGVALLPGGERVPIAARRQTDFMQALLRYQRKEVR